MYLLVNSDYCTFYVFLIIFIVISLLCGLQLLNFDNLIFFVFAVSVNKATRYAICYCILEFILMRLRRPIIITEVFLFYQDTSICKDQNN